ncbi:hypothetical protein Syun_030345 [Stephania yunnanensis]|uniref:Uncharacterized protein n=1 Tax=Stephania yunnanensis TaxID=152371 RepID=A0AAP0E7A4_9MAGN
MRMEFDLIELSIAIDRGDANTGEKTDWMMKEYRSLNKEEEDRKMGIKVVNRVSNKKKNGATKEKEPPIKMIDLGLYKIYLKPESKTKIDNRRGNRESLGRRIRWS